MEPNPQGIRPHEYHRPPPQTADCAGLCRGLSRPVVAGRGTGHAPQGDRHRSRCAIQPAGGLRPGRGPGRHGRPDHPNPLHRPERAGHAAAAGHQRARWHAHAAQERGRGAGHGHPAPLRPTRTGHRRGRVLAGQCQIAARRHPDRHAPQGRRRPDLCAGPGQPAGGRRRRLCGRLQGPDQPPERRPHPQRRLGGAQRAHAMDAATHHPVRPAIR